MNKFSYKRLGDIAEVSLSSIDKKINEGEKPVNLCNFVDVYYNWAITKHYSNSFMRASVTFREYNDFLLKKGYVAITKDSETRDDIGISTYIADDLDDTCLGYHCALIKPKENEICGKYLNALLNTEYARKIFSFQASGSGQRYTLAKESIENIKIPLPDLSVQKKIGNFFSYIDRKIELNNQINDNLSKLAKELYDYWFVQFDFPNEEGKPYKSSGGKMVWNEILKRKIPITWNNCTLSEVADIVMGQSPSGESYNKNQQGISFFQGCSDFGEYFPEVTTYTTQPSRIAHAGDVLISVRAPVGTTNIAIEECCIGRGLAAIRSKDNSQSYIYNCINNFEKIFDKMNSNGTTFGALTKDMLYSLNTVKPSQEIINKYKMICSSWENMMKTVELENKKLAQLRPFLLPLLINGQVTIKN